MPQSLIESMASGKVVIASDNRGSRSIIRDGKNGYLFKVGDHEGLAEKINTALSKNQKMIRVNAKRSVKQFSWRKLSKVLNNIIS
mgnify:FL=1